MRAESEALTWEAICIHGVFVLLLDMCNLTPLTNWSPDTQTDTPCTPHSQLPAFPVGCFESTAKSPRFPYPRRFHIQSMSSLRFVHSTKCLTSSQQSKSLQFLDLSQNTLDKKAIDYISAALPQAPEVGLSSLKLDDCQLRATVLEALGASRLQSDKVDC